MARSRCSSSCAHQRGFLASDFDAVTIDHVDVQSQAFLKEPILPCKEPAVPQRGRYKGPVDDRAIGRKLREIRLSRGMTQTELAEELGINQSLISEYEKGSVRLHAPLVAGFAKALHVSADEILSLKAVRTNGTHKNRRFVRRLRHIEQLPPTQQDTVLKLLDGGLQGQRRSTRR